MARNFSALAATGLDTAVPFTTGPRPSPTPSSRPSAGGRGCRCSGLSLSWRGIGAGVEVSEHRNGELAAEDRLVEGHRLARCPGSSGTGSAERSSQVLLAVVELQGSTLGVIASKRENCTVADLRAIRIQYTQVGESM